MLRLSCRGRWIGLGWLHIAWVLLGTVVFSVPAAASEVVLEPHPATRCVSVVEGAPTQPAYPELALARGDSGKVVVDLSFTSADTRPAVRVVDRTPLGEAFEDAVVAHARQLRATCLRAEDGPLRLRREYVFRPDGGPVRWFRDEPVNRASSELVRCVVHTSGGKAPTYPRSALRDGVAGRVLAEARFDGPDQPPQVKVHARPDRDVLVRAVVEWARGLRMPCHAGDAPVHMTWTYEFKFVGESYGFKGVDLPKLLPAVKDIRQQTLRLNTAGMKCPFEVSFQYRQPVLPNRVGEIGEPFGDRAPLLTWLEGIEIVGTPPQLDAMFGDTVRLVVPCVNIDLKPKE